MTMLNDALAEIFEGQARWRDMQAKEYPDDARNARSAESLKSLAAYVRSLPADDQRVTVIAGDYNPVMLRGGEDVARLVSRYGFDSPRYTVIRPPFTSPENHEQFLDELAETVAPGAWSRRKSGPGTQ